MRSFSLFIILFTLPLIAQPPLEDDGVRVSVLGYHFFSPQEEASAMQLPTGKFRKQMETLKASGIPIVSLPQFLKWRRGEDTLPPQAFLITMDDGWKSVYTEAFPVLKELNIPFTIYLYKNYVGSDKGGRALSLEMIREMIASGLCTIGSHSVSHPYPSKVRKESQKGTQSFDAYLRNELGTSKTFLEETFQVPVTTYAYPGGYHTSEMHHLADELGYDHLFTVIPGKVRRDSKAHTLPRYIILGNHEGAFEASLSFSHQRSLSDISTPTELPYLVTPGSGHLIANRLPTIRAQLSDIKNLAPDSLIMRVGGFGPVPAIFDPKTQTLSWTVNRPLRQKICKVSIQWKLKGSSKYQPALNWHFRIDLEAIYQPE